MDATPIRCTTRRRPGGPACNARLLDAVPDTVDISGSAPPPPGCVLIQCPRCGTQYVVCAKRAA